MKSEEFFVIRQLKRQTESFGSHCALVHNFVSLVIITIFDILKAKANLSKVSDFIVR